MAPARLSRVFVRRIRAELNLAPGRSLQVLARGGNALDHERLDRNMLFLKTLGRLDSITTVIEAPESATTLVGSMEILIPLAGLIDKDAELTRLAREIDKQIGIRLATH